MVQFVLADQRRVDFDQKYDPVSRMMLLNECQYWKSVYSVIKKRISNKLQITNHCSILLKKTWNEKFS